jgi:PQQ-like domain
MIKRVCFSLMCTGAVAWTQVSAAPSSDWLQFGFDPTHSGINPNEFLLNPSNVQLLALKYSKTFSAPAQGTPVFLGNVATSQGVIDLLFVKLNDGSLFALNAANGAQVWAHIPTTTPLCGQDGSSPKCLITSSPAIDPRRNFVYSFSRNDGKIHKYAVATGLETVDANWPEVSSAKPDVEKGSSAIAFATSSTDGDTYLYMTHSSFLANDGGDYQGHITAINLRTGGQIVFNAVCSEQGSKHFVENGTPGQDDCYQLQTTDSAGDPIPAGNAGIWGRAAATYDPSNDSIYISTANGLYDPTYQFNYGGSFWGDSVLRLPAALKTERFTPLGSYTPPNFDGLMRNDADLGSASLAIIPTSMTQAYSFKHLGIQAGKDADVRIIDLDDMNTHDGPLWGCCNESALYVQSVPQGNEVKTQPLIWQNPNDGTVMVIISNDFGISASQLIMDGSNNPQLSASWLLTGSSLSPQHGQTYGGGSPVMANGILYYASAAGLVALDPATGTVLATKTDMGVSTSAPGNFHKQSPIVVNGRIYVTDENANLWAYEGDEIFPNGFD